MSDDEGVIFCEAPLYKKKSVSHCIVVHCSDQVIWTVWLISVHSNSVVNVKDVALFLYFPGKYNNWDKVDPAELFSKAPTEKKEANPKLNMVKFLQVGWPINWLYNTSVLVVMWFLILIRLESGLWLVTPKPIWLFFFFSCSDIDLLVYYYVIDLDVVSFPNVKCLEWFWIIVLRNNPTEQYFWSFGVGVQL